MNLQKELYEARTYHINLHVEYTQLRNVYEQRVNVTDEEWRAVENLGLTEHVNKVISKFWEDIEYITTAFFEILELLNRKDYLEKSILAIWRSQLVKDKEPSPPEEAPPVSEDGITVVPGYLEYLNSQLIELKGRIKWVEFNLMKYKFAASYGSELKSIIDNVVKGSKKLSKWQLFSRSKPKKLGEEVEWYRKRLKFFTGDVQRIKSVQQAIFQKCVSPEDQKRFPSRTHTLENALKGIPTNCPGSWIETSRHSGLSMNPSLLSNPSHNGALPWTASSPGSFKIEVQCPSSVNQTAASTVGVGETSERSRNEMHSISTPRPDSSNFGNNDASTAHLFGCKQESRSKVDSVVNRHTSLPDLAQGDLSKTDVNKAQSLDNFLYHEQFESNNSVLSNCEKRGPNEAKTSSNPFEDDDNGDVFSDDGSDVSTKTVYEKGHKPLDESVKNATVQPSTRSSSYASADDSCEPNRHVASFQGVSTTLSHYSSVSPLAPGVYLPCSVPYSAISANGGAPIGFPMSFPHMSFTTFPHSNKPQRSLLKKFSSFLRKK